MQKKIMRFPICRICGCQGRKVKGGVVCTNQRCVGRQSPVDIYTFEGIERPFGARK